MKRFPWNGVPALLLAATLVGCSSLETRITRPDDQPTSMELVIEVAEATASASAAPDAGFNVVVEQDGNTLNIADAEIVVRELAFRRQEGEGCVDADGSGEPDDDSCAELVIDPDLIDLPVDQENLTSGAVVVEPGTYDALVFELHETREEDTNVLGERPGMLGSSVRVTGSYNGESLGDSAMFVPTGDVVLTLEDPIRLDEGAASAMTLTVDVASWFRVDGDLVRPDAAAADTTLARQVSENILASFSLRPGT